VYASVQILKVNIVLRTKKYSMAALHMNVAAKTPLAVIRAR
jgi:hypothetical protein